MNAYVQDTSKWEAWQREYRLGTILILPPPEVATRIDRLRAKYDPRSFAMCGAHISLSDPLCREMSPELHEEIRRVLKAIEPFRIFFDEPSASTQHTGVFLPIRPQQSIDALKDALHSSSAFSDRAHERRTIPAHMTIAEFLSMQDSQVLCEKLRGATRNGSFMCDRLSLVVPNQMFRFQQVYSFPLGGSPAPQRVDRQP